jgi:hypothetical protein
MCSASEPTTAFRAAASSRRGLTEPEDFIKSWEAKWSKGAWEPVEVGEPTRRGVYADPLLVRWTTSLIDLCSTVLNRKVRLGVARKLRFTATERVLAPAHTHPIAAAARADASEFMTTIASRLKKRRYDVSIAARERRTNAAGPRQFRVAKDLLSESRQDTLLPDDLVTMVDSCYYHSLEDFGRYAGHDMAIFALLPDALTRTTEDSRWSFTSPETVREDVAGGAAYEHQVWDWNKDFLVLWSGWSAYIYDVVVYPVATSRAVVLLLLARIINMPKFLLSWLMPDIRLNGLARMTVYAQGEFLYGQFGRVGGEKVCIRVAGGVADDEVAISPNLFRTLSIASHIPNTDKKVVRKELLPAEVERLARLANEKVGTHGCYLLSRFFSTDFEPRQFVNYQSYGALKLEDGEPTVALAAVPLVGPGCGPTTSSNNEARAIKTRLDDVANTTKFSKDLIELGVEFAELVIKAPGKGVPWDKPELRDQQDRPTQRARRVMEERFTADHGPLKTVSFQKKESYAKVSDPRLINQVPTDHTNRLCSFSGSIKQYLKSANGRWFMVGKTPEQIAKGLRGLQRAHGELAGGDYGRMDGRTSADYRRYVHRPIYMRFFASDYHAELDELLSKEETATTRTMRFGHRTRTSGANLSGSGITTDLNTLNAGFNEYVARRRSGEDPNKAFGSLGCYFGDDSVLASAMYERVEAVAKETGMQLTREAVPDGVGPGYVVFLSRVYPDVVTSLASHPATKRALKKLCTVAVGPKASKTEKLLKLALKVEGVLASDPLAPVLSQYARALKRVYGLGEVMSGAGKALEGRRAQDASYRHKMQSGPYPVTEADVPFLEPSVAQDLGIGLGELALLISRLDEAQTEEHLAAISTADGGVACPDWARLIPSV